MAHLVKRKLKGGERWYVRYYDGGRARWIAAGTNRKAAAQFRDKLAVTQLQHEHGLLTDKSDWTLRQLAKVYLKRLALMKPRSAAWRSYRMAQLLQRLGDLPLERIDRAVFERYAAGRLEEGRTAGTVNSDLAVLRHALGCAVRWREETGLQKNRADDWRPVKGEVRQARYLEAVEMKAVLEQSAALGGPAHVFLELYMTTGARPGELLQLTREDFNGSTVRLPALKGGVARVVAVDSDLVDRAASAAPAWTKQKVRIHWEKVRVRAGLVGVRFYDIRHSVASEMLKHGATVRDVQRLFGHRTARMTERYAHFSLQASTIPTLKWTQ